MEIFHVTQDTIIPPPFFGAVVAMGNFDAVHKGHQSLLTIARAHAQELKKPFGIITFEPHPRAFFRPQDPAFRITPYNLKLDRLKESGADVVFVFAFNDALAHCTADDFVTKYLQKNLGLTTCIVGADFHFGHERKGSAATLIHHGINCVTVDLVKDTNGGVYAASRIRGLLQSGLMMEANDLLGWQWEIRGEVIKGDQRGRKIGFPTANMRLGETLHPGFGVYAGKVKIKGEEKDYLAAINIGIRPMFESKIPLLEAHLLDFHGDLYGQELRVCPLIKLRGEAKYPDLEALIAQIEKDCAATRDFFAQNP